MEKDQVKEEAKEQVSAILQTVIQVITNPAGFFREMPKAGGFLQPFIFMVAMGVVGGFIQAVLSLIGLSPGGFASGVGAIILMPILVAIFGFIGAAILFVIWKMLGSRKSFETAYRGMAYSAAITPITSVLGIIPYLGGIAGLAWMIYLLVLVSIEVHEIKPKTAWIAFGVMGAILAMMSLSAEVAGRKMAQNMEQWEIEMQSAERQAKQFEDMSPEEAGEAMGKFLKGFSQHVEE